MDFIKSQVENRTGGGENRDENSQAHGGESGNANKMDIAKDLYKDFKEGQQSGETTQQAAQSTVTENLDKVKGLFNSGK